jgi:transcriptional regulator with XRE-family HTH domain
VDDGRVGRAIRVVRVRKGWRQKDLGAAAHVSQQVVSRIEQGRFDRVALATTRRVAKELDMTISLSTRWLGGDVFQLLDAEHAVLVDESVRRLRRIGWELLVEYSFNHFGDRGSVDIVAWHPRRRAVLIVEVKSRIVDVQELLGTLDRKVRVVPLLLARERGWRAVEVGGLLVVPRTKQARNAVERHAATFAVVLPARGLAVRRWLAAPAGRLDGIWFVAFTHGSGGNHGRTGRVRLPGTSAAGRSSRPRLAAAVPAADEVGIAVDLPPDVSHHNKDA